MENLEIYIKNKNYRVKMIQKIDKDKSIYKSIDKPFEENYNGEKAQLILKDIDINLITEGLVYSKDVDQIVFVQTQQPIINERKEKRILVGQIPCKIIEKTILSKKEYEGFIIDISLHGAKIQTEAILKKEKHYVLFAYLHKKEFYAEFEIRNIKSKGKINFYGCLFINIDFTSNRILKHFIEKLEGVSKDLEDLDLTNLF